MEHVILGTIKTRLPSTTLSATFTEYIDNRWWIAARHELWQHMQGKVYLIFALIHVVQSSCRHNHQIKFATEVGPCNETHQLLTISETTYLRLFLIYSCCYSLRSVATNHMELQFILAHYHDIL